MKVLLIYNPVSGKTHFRTERLGKIVNALAENGNEVVVYQTQGKGDARAYCSNVLEGQYDKIVCCGGDGTLHEVVNGMLIGNKSIPLGYIPAGSTNDYAKNLGITTNNALKCVCDGNIQKLDVGSFNGEFFNYVAAFGAFTEVSFSTPQKNKNELGYIAYLLEGIKSLSSIRPYYMKCQLDDLFIEDDFLIGMITNAISVAGIKNKNSSQTRLDDGMLEYLMIKMPQNISDLQAIIFDLLNGKVDSNFIHYGQASSFQIESDVMAWTLDGEAGGNVSTVSIKTHQQVLNMIVK